MGGGVKKSNLDQPKLTVHIGLDLGTFWLINKLSQVGWLAIALAIWGGVLHQMKIRLTHPSQVKLGLGLTLATSKINLDHTNGGH